MDTKVSYAGLSGRSLNKIGRVVWFEISPWLIKAAYAKWHST